MVLGLRSKNRKAGSFQVLYLINVQEIKPWPPSQSLKSVQSVLLYWENGDQSYGSCVCDVGDGRIEFNESFQLPVTLYKESSRKGDGFQKNILEFSMYEARKDKAMKGQPLGSAVINLADHGIIGDPISVSTVVNFKKSSKSMGQPLLYVCIQSVDWKDSSVSNEGSLGKDRIESVSEITNEGIDEESETASFALFTDDDNDISSHSSQTVPSSSFHSSRASPSQNGKRGIGSSHNGLASAEESNLFSNSVAVNLDVKLADAGFNFLNYSSSITHPTTTNPSLQNSESDNMINAVPSGDQVKVLENANRVGLEDKGKIVKNEWHRKELLQKQHSFEADKVPQVATRNQIKLRSNTLASSRTATDVQGNTRRDKLKHLKSIQLQFESDEIDEPSLVNSHFLEKEKRFHIPDNVEKPLSTNAPSGGEKTKSILPDSRIKGEEEKSIVPGNRISLKFEPKESEQNVSVDSKASNDPYSAVSKQGKTTNRVEPIKPAKEIGKKLNEGGKSRAADERREITGSIALSKNELLSKVEMLEAELTEAAALEAGLYSVIAEHGSSTSKVHASARRLSRLWLHASKASSLAKRASAARAIISGIVLVSKACGNDVARLAFWLSNAIVLRAVVSEALDVRENEKTKSKKHYDDWEKPQNFIVALEKVEAWIFSRIVESIWWQTLTPHMQSTAVKGSSRKAHSKKFRLGDPDQSNFAIDLWKRAFKDACERLCPVRAGGHECGCLPVLARLVMQQLVGRLDAAMFNAILRESADDMPTDPISDPISDPNVLPIPSGKSSFGAGAQLKNAIGNWSRWLTDLFGIDDNDSPEDIDPEDFISLHHTTSFKAFHLLKALSNLMMLPFEMLADRDTRKEVCPLFGASVIKRVLSNFVPDEFNPDPIPETIFEALDSKDNNEVKNECIASFPCIATPTTYSPPPVASLRSIIGQVGTSKHSGSALVRKSYTSDDELDELDSPMTAVIFDNSRTSASTELNWMNKGGRKVKRYQLLRQVWKHSD